MVTRTRAAGVSRILLLAGLVVAACTPPPPSASPTSAPGTPAAAQTREQALRVPLTEPPTLDPGLAEDVVSIDVVRQTFEGLVTFDEKGALIGLGAEKWDVSADGLTYTFTLRQGPKWSDGKSVTAQDYAWAWKRNVDPKTASPYANTLYPIKNAQPINDGQLDPEQLGVQARDDRTLVVTLEKPAAYFMRLASTWTLMPLRQDIIDTFDAKWTEPQNIVTNGPYRLREWQHDAQIVLERNEEYWGQKPALQKVTYRLYPEGGSEQVLAAYEAGELDTFGTGASFELPPNQVDRILADPKLKSELTTFDQSATNFITINNLRPHLNDPRVRQALGQALDRPSIIESVLKRAGKPAYTVHPTGIAGRNADVWPKDDVAAAKKLLADAGFPDGRGFPEITFTYNTSAQWKPLAEYLQQRWKETLGLNVRLDSMELAVFLKWRRGDDWVQRGDLYRGGWFSDYEDPNNWFNVLWESGSDPLAFNTGWKNDQYDALVRQAAGELDQARRDAAYGQAEEILAREYPVIPVFHYEIRTLVRPYVQNFLPERVLGLTPVSKITLSNAR